MNYIAEKQDKFFEGEKGYTNFGRTRKGGDRRPRAVAPRPKIVRYEKSSPTIMHFFGAHAASKNTSKNTTPSPMRKPKCKRKKIIKPKATRILRIGQPEEAEKNRRRAVQELRNKVSTTAAEGALSVEPRKYRKWGGSVSLTVCYYYYYYYYLSHYWFVNCCPMSHVQPSPNNICTNR